MIKYTEISLYSQLFAKAINYNGGSIPSSKNTCKGDELKYLMESFVGYCDIDEEISYKNLANLIYGRYLPLEAKEMFLKRGDVFIATDGFDEVWYKVKSGGLDLGFDEDHDVLFWEDIGVIERCTPTIHSIFVEEL